VGWSEDHGLARSQSQSNQLLHGAVPRRESPVLQPSTSLMKYGYARVSTADQDFSYQLAELEQAGCDRIFRDKASGSKMSRPEFDLLLTYLREGDTVVVWKIDRLGRNFTEMVATMADLARRAIAVVATSQGIDTSTPMGRAMA
jgi:DNA invertase Pin-like site-specific DNA recombinase